MSWSPISLSVPQYEDSNGDPYSGAVLKAYAAGTSTPISMATDSTGGTTAGSVALNASGYPAVSGNVIIPHVSANYKLTLYPTQAAADANSGALWSVDNLTPLGTVALLSLTTIGDSVVATTAGAAARIAAKADVAAHATTADPWVAREIVLTGSAVTFTDIADAPYVGAVAWVKQNAAHVWTNGAVFSVRGGANYTATAGDWIRIYATTVSTFEVIPFNLGTMATQNSDVLYKTVAYTIAQADNGKTVLFDVASSVAATLPLISGLTLPFRINIALAAGTGGTVVPTVSGGDGISLTGGQVANFSMSVHGASVALVADGNTSKWIPVGLTLPATQSEQESASSQSAWVTPGKQHNHPSAAKTWACVAGDGTSAPTSYNVASITDTGAGAIVIVIATDFSSGNWAAMTDTDANENTRSSQIQSRDAGNITIVNVDDTGSAADPDAYFFVGFGDQA